LALRCHPLLVGVKNNAIGVIKGKGGIMSPLSFGTIPP